jgi:SepF-like predicted cell division protein (DUF552 family)
VPEKLVKEEREREEEEVEEEEDRRERERPNKKKIIKVINVNSCSHVVSFQNF